jgi:NAD(P)-dependent dehydrogenase (short-subunit alcohol dehydrogenase family)
VNVRAPMLLCAEFAKRHDGRPGGRIINLSSGQGLAPMPNNLPYAASKGAIEALTLSLSASLAGKGITVNAIDPGPTDTGWLSDDLRMELLKEAPFGRIGTADDAANLALYLASSGSAVGNRAGDSVQGRPVKLDAGYSTVVCYFCSYNSIVLPSGSRIAACTFPPSRRTWPSWRPPCLRATAITLSTLETVRPS